MLTLTTLVERIIAAVAFALLGLVIACYSGCLPPGICRLLKVKYSIRQWCPYSEWRKTHN